VPVEGPDHGTDAKCRLQECRLHSSGAPTPEICTLQPAWSLITDRVPTACCPPIADRLLLAGRCSLIAGYFLLSCPRYVPRSAS
jgi:hypothetical protein